MCMYSHEVMTRPAQIGENLKIQTFQGTHFSGKVFAGEAKPGTHGHSACVVCMPDNADLRLSGLSGKFQRNYGLVSSESRATFKQGQKGRYDTCDRIEFPNGEVVRLAQMPNVAAVFLGVVGSSGKQRERMTTAEQGVLVGATANLGDQTMAFTVRGENPMGQYSATRRITRVPAALIRAGQGVANHVVSSVGMLVAAIGIAALLH